MAPNDSQRDPAPGAAVNIFIGHHKVGSSALQHFLAANAFALASSGILYPAVEAEGMALLLGRAMAGRDDDRPIPINYQEAHNALAFRMISEEPGQARVPEFHRMLPASRQMFRIIAQQIRALAPAHVVIASEVFANFGKSAPGLIDALGAQPWVGRPTLHATLRRIDDYLVSWHAQRLRFGHRIEPLSAGGLPHYFRTVHFDYRVMLEPWIARMPHDRLVLRSYGDVLRAGGSVQDFMAHSGIAFPDGLKPDGQSNVGFHRAAIEVLRRGNRDLGEEQAAELRRTVAMLTPQLELPRSGEIEMFGEEARRLVAERFEPIHRWLSETAGVPAFFPDQDEVVRVRPIPEREANAAFLAAIRTQLDEVGDAAVRDYLGTLRLEDGA